MTIDQLLSILSVMPFVLATFGIPIALTVWARRHPYVLSPFQKLIVSFLLLLLRYGLTFSVFPHAIEVDLPTHPLASASIYALMLFPQSVIGVVIATVLLIVRLDQERSRETNWWWWFATLCGLIWSTFWFLSLGVAFQGW